MESGEPERAFADRGARRVVLWTLAGLALGACLTIVVLRVLHRDSVPTLTPDLFHAARQRWKANEPADYDLEVRVTGSQPAVYRVEVRGGQAQAAWRNGQPLKQRRTFGTWSVPGMFGTIGRDVEAIERRAAGRADPRAPELTLRAEFDPRYGYPRRYQRIEWSSPVEVSWEVVEFRLVP
ncbi:MAG: DUF6174 domain-containing protein [Pirellulaceae bacterium]